MRVNVWDHGENYDIAAPGDATPCNYLCFKRDVLKDIKQEPIEIGVYRFEPGEAYTRFGSKKKTSASFAYYEGEPLIYYGHYEDYILFTKTGDPVANFENYLYIFFAWSYFDDSLLFLTYSNCARIIEMDRKEVWF